ncbi:MAG: hypothetical protein M9899_00005 [Bdellovibrionaceae bacterium]|nr:hypothetical protein [Pseudobdellovibrionaceae bacterium]
MKKFLIALSSLLLLGGCFGSSNGRSKDGISYKYRISSPDAHGIATITSNFRLQWNEAEDGTISGVYINEDTEETLNITGTSGPSGRAITVGRTEEISGVLYFVFTLPAGDLSGEISISVETYDSSDQLVDSDTVDVIAETDGIEDDGGDGGDGGDDGDPSGTIVYQSIHNCTNAGTGGGPSTYSANIRVEITPDDTEFGFSGSLIYSDDRPSSFTLNSIPFVAHDHCSPLETCFKHTSQHDEFWLNMLGNFETGGFYVNLNYFNDDYSVNITCSTKLPEVP